MEHVLLYTARDGAPAHRRAASLEEAVQHVEHLRNVEGVQDVTVHPLGDAVPLAFRAWYRVELPAGEQPPAVGSPASAEPELQPSVVPALEALPEAEREPVVLAPEEPAEEQAEEPTAALPEPAADHPEAVEVPGQPVPQGEGVGVLPAADVIPNGKRDVRSLGFFS